MAMEISVHDNIVLSYMVECQEHRITLHTAFYDHEPHEYTDIIFAGVVAHHFEAATFPSILFSVEEASPEDVYTEFRSVFERNKNYGWLEISYDTEQDLMAKLKDQGVKGFLISSSYGMDGFVLALEMRLMTVSVYSS